MDNSDDEQFENMTSPYLSERRPSGRNSGNTRGEGVLQSFTVFGESCNNPDICSHLFIDGRVRPESPTAGAWGAIISMPLADGRIVEEACGLTGKVGEKRVEYMSLISGMHFVYRLVQRHALFSRDVGVIVHTHSADLVREMTGRKALKETSLKLLTEVACGICTKFKYVRFMEGGNEINITYDPFRAVDKTPMRGKQDFSDSAEYQHEFRSMLTRAMQLSKYVLDAHVGPKSRVDHANGQGNTLSLAVDTACACTRTVNFRPSPVGTVRATVMGRYESVASHDLMTVIRNNVSFIDLYFLKTICAGALVNNIQDPFPLAVVNSTPNMTVVGRVRLDISLKWDSNDVRKWTDLIVVDHLPVPLHLTTVGDSTSAFLPNSFYLGDETTLDRNSVDIPHRDHEYWDFEESY